ncbi:Rhomboid family protein [Roseimaritima multifibrata]|uniref:Rhomboid family protein n=1 Tax=Roseimaritima multifibrata TaxID=1930274 RepID=A0A517MEG0_9BACT|nr:rhomboid family intramembrane serine protease [Roseimaritima multifibrata]QDS93269.1 Rhomboid family protein [Roseimaritima multifibrata]
MGLYDRDYSRYEPSQGGSLGSSLGLSGRSMTTILIVVNVAAFVLNALLKGTTELPSGQVVRVSFLFDLMSVHSDTLTKPWMWWQFLTYGFAHDDRNLMHLGGNMLVLFFFGNTVERQLGRMEFLRFYLVAIFLGGLFWGTRAFLTGLSPDIPLLGASGGVQAVTVLFAFLFPHATILLFFVLPVKAWIAAVGFAILNVMGAVGGTGGTAYDVHLVGMAFAAFYHLQGIQLGKWTPASLLGQGNSRPRRGPKLRLHDPDKKRRNDDAEADRILEKIHREGESKLSRGERKFMEKYSQRKRAERGD